MDAANATSSEPTTLLNIGAIFILFEANALELLIKTSAGNVPNANAPITKAPWVGDAVPIAALCANIVNPQGTINVSAPTIAGVICDDFSDIFESLCVQFFGIAGMILLANGSCSICRPKTNIITVMTIVIIVNTVELNAIVLPTKPNAEPNMINAINRDPLKIR